MVTTYPVMRQSAYDSAADGTIDTTEGIRVVTEFPASPKKGDIVLKNGKVFVCIDA